MANTTTDNNFERDVILSKKLVLIDFWAEWCGPCRQLAPTIDEVAREMKGTIEVFKMDIDQNPNTPTQYGVRSIPTLMLIKNGRVVGTKIGALPKSSIISWINESNK